MYYDYALWIKFRVPANPLIAGDLIYRVAELGGRGYALCIQGTILWGMDKLYVPRAGGGGTPTRTGGGRGIL